MNILDRLREPSTYAGIASFFAAIFANLQALAPGQETVSLTILAIAILSAIAAVFVPAPTSKLKAEVLSMKAQLYVQNAEVRRLMQAQNTQN